MRRVLVLLAAVASACGAGSSGGADASVPLGDEDSGAADAAVTLSDAGTARDAGVVLGAPGTQTRTMPAFSARSYDVRIPQGYDGLTPLPVLLVLHGGGGNRAEAKQITCPGGDTSAPECLEALADARGFITVFPDGTPGPVQATLRTWNAGGGENGWQCVSGYACSHGVDELAYFTALLADLQTLVHVDPHRVYVTGHSNGAAMAHRLACELPQNVAGIAAVAGENQFATTRSCPSTAKVLEVHGDADPCWPFDGGAQSCADTNPGSKLSVGMSLEGWQGRNGCTSARTATDVPDTQADGTTTVRYDSACPAGHEVVLYDVIGGGHTWPGGYARTTNNGPISMDFSANRVMLDFFAAP